MSFKIICACFTVLALIAAVIVMICQGVGLLCQALVSPFRSRR